MHSPSGECASCRTSIVEVHGLAECATCDVVCGFSETAFRYIQAFHAVSVVDTEVDLDKLIIDKDALDSSLYSLLTEATHHTVKIGSCRDGSFTDVYVIEESETYSTAVNSCDVFINDCLNELTLWLVVADGVEVFTCFLLRFHNLLGFGILNLRFIKASTVKTEAEATAKLILGLVPGFNPSYKFINGKRVYDLIPDKVSLVKYSGGPAIVDDEQMNGETPSGNNPSGGSSTDDSGSGSDVTDPGSGEDEGGGGLGA